MIQEYMIWTEKSPDETFINQIEWEEWLAQYSKLRSEAFLRILEDTKRKGVQWRIS